MSMPVRELSHSKTMSLGGFVGLRTMSSLQCHKCTCHAPLRLSVHPSLRNLRQVNCHVRTSVGSTLIVMELITNCHDALRLLLSAHENLQRNGSVKIKPISFASSITIGNCSGSTLYGRLALLSFIMELTDVAFQFRFDGGRWGAD